MRAIWCQRCADILRMNADRYTNAQVAAWIQAQTGKHFTAITVSRYRASAGLPHPPAVGFSRALRKWRAIEAVA